MNRIFCHWGLWRVRAPTLVAMVGTVHDAYRHKFIDTALRNLRRGQIPSELDQRMLFEIPVNWVPEQYDKPMLQVCWLHVFPCFIQVVFILWYVDRQ
jgi:hypothetical protein